MNTALLESRLAANPSSPLFARLASNYLTEGHLERAVDVCIEGLKHFPAYSTAHLILGQCYDALGRHVEAALEYRRVLKAVPENPRVRELLRRVDGAGQEAFRVFAEDRVKKFAAKKGTLTLEGFVAGSEPSTPRPEESEDTPAVSHHPNKIVTATLAEIYATQGEYGEAIRAYKRLLVERPVESDRYVRRITELEELSRVQKAGEEN